MVLQLETTRLILRPFEQRDIPAFYNYRSDPEVARYQGWQWPYTLELATDFIHEMMAQRPGIPGQWFQLAATLRKTGEIIGDVAFHRLHDDPQQAEIAFTLSRQYQGQGFGFEMTSCLLKYLFGEMGLHRVRANCDPQNAASVKLLEKLGMRHEGRFVESLWYKGAWADEDWYAILRREWEGEGTLK